jgi:hypothetical protein
MKRGHRSRPAHVQHHPPRRSTEGARVAASTCTSILLNTSVFITSVCIASCAFGWCVPVLHRCLPLDLCVPLGASSGLRSICETCTDMAAVRAARFCRGYHLQRCLLLACRPAGSYRTILDTDRLLLGRIWLVRSGTAAVMVVLLLAIRRQTRQNLELVLCSRMSSCMLCTLVSNRHCCYEEPGARAAFMVSEANVLAFVGCHGIEVALRA